MNKSKMVSGHVVNVGVHLVVPDDNLTPVSFKVWLDAGAVFCLENIKTEELAQKVFDSIDEYWIARYQDLVSVTALQHGSITDLVYLAGIRMPVGKEHHDAEITGLFGKIFSAYP